MKNLLEFILVSITLALTNHSAHQSENVFTQDLKTDISGWTTFGKSAKVSLCPQVPGSNSGALQFDYLVDKSEFDALLRTVPVGSLAKAKFIKFRMMADSDAPVEFVLQEKGGGRYYAACLAVKGKWQDCELSPSDFHLNSDPGNPPDPDGKLDLDQVEGFGFADLHVVAAGIGNAEVNEFRGVELGQHKIYLDSFSIGTDATIRPNRWIAQGLCWIHSRTRSLLGCHWVGPS